MHTCTHTCTQADTDPDGLNELALFDADGDGMLDGGAEQEAARAAYREASKARRAKVAQALAEENKALEEERERMRLTGTTYTYAYAYACMLEEERERMRLTGTTYTYAYAYACMLEEERERMRLTGTTARSSSYLLMYLHTY